MPISIEWHKIIRTLIHMHAREFALNFAINKHKTIPDVLRECQINNDPHWTKHKRVRGQPFCTCIQNLSIYLFLLIKKMFIVQI